MNYSNKIFDYTTFLLSLVPAFFLFAILIFIGYYALPSIRFNGLHFFTSYYWKYGDFSVPPISTNGISHLEGASFGALLFALGTALTSAIAILIAFPVSFISSLTVELYLTKKIKKLAVSMIELFAGIPSVVLGLWGLVVLVPLLEHHIEPWLSQNLSFIPLFSGPLLGGGQGIIASSFILSIMVTPIITSVMVSSFDTVSPEVKQGLYSLGATRWEVGKFLILKYLRGSTIGGTLLGLGRALGETMAVLMVAGGAFNSLPTSMFAPINTMAAWVASQLGDIYEDTSGMFLSGLAEVALILMIISLIVNLIGRKIAGRGALRGYTND